MMFDDDVPTPPSGIVIGGDLSTLSVEELAERITLLEREIARIREILDGKQSSRARADTFFKT